MLLGFGELMMRVTPPGFLRFRQALPGAMDVTFGGGEANACSSVSLLGGRVRFLTALPKTPVADAAIGYLSGLGIDTRCILRREGRLGIYFLEMGANQRGSSVLYDRENSSISLAAPEEYNFDGALEGVRRVHVTGITPSLTRNAFLSTLELARRAKQAGALVSCDLNFRNKLWRWQPDTKPQRLAQQSMSEILPYVDLVIANEEDAEKVLGIRAEGTSVEQGKINPGAYLDVARQINRRFGNVSQVAITLRESISASHNNWGAMLYVATEDKAYFAPTDGDGYYRPYQICDIVDRVGAGDSFGGALMYALDSAEMSEPSAAIDFAAAASCLKHSVYGDVNYTTAAEVKALAAGQTVGRVQR